MGTGRVSGRERLQDHLHNRGIWNGELVAPCGFEFKKKVYSNMEVVPEMAQKHTRTLHNQDETDCEAGHSRYCEGLSIDQAKKHPKGSYKDPAQFQNYELVDGV